MNDQTLSSIFTQTYESQFWGCSNDPADRFFSGHGSRDPIVVAPYLASVRGLLHGLRLANGKKPSVIDIGCGDFFVGSRLEST